MVSTIGSTPASHTGDCGVVFVDRTGISPVGCLLVDRMSSFILDGSQSVSRLPSGQPESRALILYDVFIAVVMSTALSVS